MRRTLLVLGAVLTIAGSMTIEISVLMLLTPIPTDALATSVVVGIVVAGMGILFLWLGRQERGPLHS